MEDRVERHLVGDDIGDLAPQLLAGRLVAGLGGLVEELLDLLVLGGPGPAVAVLRPEAVVEPAQQQVRVVAEDRGVAGCDEDLEVTAVDLGVLGRGLGDAQGGLDAGRGPALLDQRGDVLDPAGVGGQDGELEVLHPGFGEQLLRLGHVVRVDGGGLVVVGVRGGDVARGGRRVPDHGGLDDLLGVQRVVQGLADPLVREPLVGGVEHQEEQAERLHRLGLRRAGEPLHVDVRDVLDGLDTAGLHGADAGRLVRDQAPDHLLGLGGVRAVVRAELLEDDLVLAGRRDELVRPRADGLGVEALDVRLDDLLRHDPGHGDAGREEREGVLELELDRAGVDGLHGVDEGHELCHQRGVLRVQDALEAEHDVVGGDGRSVVEGRALAQRRAVGGGVDLLGHLGGECGPCHECCRIEIDQPLEDVHIGGVRGRARGDHRVEAGRQRVGQAGLDEVAAAALARRAVGGRRRAAARGKARGDGGRGTHGAGVTKEGAALDTGCSQLGHGSSRDLRWASGVIPGGLAQVLGDCGT